MKEQIINTLKAVIATLNLVDVRGKENMDRQLGSIVALERCVGMVDGLKDPGEEENHEN